MLPKVFWPGLLLGIVCLLHLFHHPGSFVRSWVRPLPEVARITPTYPNLVYYNRVPKSGSENMAFLIKNLAGPNNFTQSRYGYPVPRHLTEAEQLREGRRACRLPRPALTDRHVHFLQLPCPATWITVVRHPVDFFISRFRYERQGRRSKGALAAHTAGGPQAEAAWRKRDISECILSAEPACSLSVGQPGDLMVAYLCGQAPHCSLVGDRGALATAKANVETFYPAVGVLEELDSTLAVLEHVLPSYFSGLQQLYFVQLHEPHRNRNSGDRSISLAARRQLEGWLAVELEMYAWLRLRLQQQFGQIHQEKI